MTTYRIEDLPDRIASKIQVNPVTGCWEWQGPPNPNGYAQVSYRGRKRWVHRVVYELLVGPLPDGRSDLDHVYALGCRSKACCWPAHLEPVTHAENMQRWAQLITYCPAGHEYTPENTVIDGNSRKCRTCLRERQRQLRAKRAAAEGRQIGLPMADRTHCPAGHEYTPENTVIDISHGRPGRKCRTCLRLRQKELRDRRRAS